MFEQLQHALARVPVEMRRSAQLAMYPVYVHFLWVLHPRPRDVLLQAIRCRAIAWQLEHVIFFVMSPVRRLF